LLESAFRMKLDELRLPQLDELAISQTSTLQEFVQMHNYFHPACIVPSGRRRRRRRQHKAIHRTQRQRTDAVLEQDGILLWINSQILDGDLVAHRIAIQMLLEFRR